MKRIIISAVGKDRPGIVAGVTEVLFRHGCNLEDASMTLLEDHFAMLFVACAPKALQLTTIVDLLTNVADSFSLQIAVNEIDVDQIQESPTGSPWMLSVVGPDRTGIVFHVAQVLSRWSINIRQLSSKLISMKDSSSLFLMNLEVDVPGSLDEGLWKEDLFKVASSEGLEVVAEPMEEFTL